RSQARLFGQDRGQGVEGEASMGAGVLLLRTHLRGRRRRSLGQEDRIVAEAVLPRRRGGQTSGHDALCSELTAIGGHRRGGAAELYGAGPLADVAPLRQRQFEVGTGVAVS